MVEDCVYPLKMKSYTCQKTVKKKKNPLDYECNSLVMTNPPDIKKKCYRFF